MVLNCKQPGIKYTMHKKSAKYSNNNGVRNISSSLYFLKLHIGIKQFKNDSLYIKSEQVKCETQPMALKVNLYTFMLPLNNNIMECGSNSVYRD